MKAPALTILLLLILSAGCSQNPSPAAIIQNKVGGRCEGCEAVFESPVAFTGLTWQDTLPDYNSDHIKLHLTGTVYKSDGTTPAPGVVLYIYHTDGTGVYPKKDDAKGWAVRHGYLRGWIKTDAQGRYAFYTTKPASYPQSTEPAHIHLITKEPDKNEYYMDDFVFSDDPHLSPDHKQRLQQKGGSGILNLAKQNGVLTASRNIILGKNIEDYK